MTMPTVIRLIASDLDGTLLRDDKTISRRTMAALRRAADAGLFVVVATGRQAGQLPDEIVSCGVSHVVASNGAIGKSLIDGDILFEDMLQPDTASAIVEHLRVEVPGVKVSAVRNQGASHSAEPGYIELLTDMEKVPHWWHMITEPLAQVVSQPTLKLVVRHPQLSADDLLEVVQSSGLRGFHATTSGAPFLEIGGDGVSKASGLIRLCELLGVNAEQVLAAGDARNDLEMIRWAGRGVAMANAVPELQAAANLVTASNQHDGLALAIEAVLAERSAKWNRLVTRS
jgi:Cof subfamily protein (haloacid dehalogenase superfamily)